MADAYMGITAAIERAVVIVSKVYARSESDATSSSADTATSEEQQQLEAAAMSAAAERMATVGCGAALSATEAAVDALADTAAVLLAISAASSPYSPSSLAVAHVKASMEALEAVLGTHDDEGEKSKPQRPAAGVVEVRAHCTRMRIRMARAIVAANALALSSSFAPSSVDTTADGGIAPAIAGAIASLDASSADHPRPNGFAAHMLALLTDVDKPLPLCADRRAFAGLNSETERYQMDLVSFALTAVTGNHSAPSIAAARSVAQWFLDAVLECAPHNLPTFYSIAAACVATLASGGDEADGDDIAALQTATIVSMIGHSQDGLRIHAFRCGAMAYGALAYARDDAFVLRTVSDVLSGCGADGSPSAPARTLFFCALAIANKVLLSGAGVIAPEDGSASSLSSAAALSPLAAAWALYKPLLLEFAVFINAAAVEDEEMSCAFAALEPAFAALPSTVRAQLPPTTRLVALARALSITTIAECVRLLSGVGGATNHVGGSAVAPAEPLPSSPAEIFLLELVEMNATDKRISHTPCMPNSNAHRSRLRLWQLVHSLLPIAEAAASAPSSSTRSAAAVYRDCWDALLPALQQHCVPINNLASVRRPIDLAVMRGYTARPDLLFPLLLPQLDNYDLRAQIAGAYALIAANVAVVHASREDVFTALYPRLQRLGNSYQHLLRIIAHIGLHALLTKRRELSSSSSSSSAAAAVFTAEHERTLHYLSNASEVGKFLSKHYSAVILDIPHETAAAQIFCVQRMDGTHWLHEAIPAATFGRALYLTSEAPCALSLPRHSLLGRQVGAALLGTAAPALFRRALRAQIALGVLPRAVPIPAVAEEASDASPTPTAAATTAVGANDEFLDYNEVSAALRAAEREREEKIATEAAEAAAAAAEEGTTDAAAQQPSASSSDNIQRKVQSWWTSEIYNQMNPRALGEAGGTAARRNLIIVGSLLDNPVNIAGLCRCGDIFAVERVIVPNKKVFEHPHFVAAARSAELWVPWEEVAPRDLTRYLQAARLEGYTIVGVEQTADSQSMAAFEFPQRAVVVLGAEGTGVPAHVLPFLDVCVEIPQFGLIRSLNVHVTGAIAMYEYAVQHMMGGRAATTSAPQLE